MGVWSNFPYTNWHELNLDWFIAEFERLQSEWDSFGYSVTATAHPGLVPNVTVTGDLTNGLNFDFTLVRGDQGDTGPEGPAGNGIASVSINGSYQITFTFTDGTVFTTPSLKGDTGSGLEILDTYATLADLQTAHPSGNAGDMYLVGVSPSFVLYLWSTSQNAWVEGGALSSPSPSITTPLMDGEASTGIEFAYSRGDHVHPTDTSRASADDLTALQTTVGNKADSTTVTALANRVSSAEGNITNLQTGKQDVLINESNIKSVNGESLLGAGSVNTHVTYSTTESVTGDIWIDGKPIYRKVIEFGSLPNNTDKTVAHNISDLDTVVKMECLAEGVISGIKQCYPMPTTSVSNTTSQIQCYLSGANIDIRTGSNVWTSLNAIIIMEYTKTTD